MTRDEAIGRIKARFDKWALDDEDMKAIQTLIPELAESEDERIIRTLQDYVKNRNWPLNGPTQDEVLAYLEKQKETGIRWFKSDNVKNPDKPYIDKVGMFYTTDGRMCYASEIEKQKEQKPSWSEEDEKMLDSIIRVVCGVGVQPNGLREKQVSWLKALRPQSKDEIYKEKDEAFKLGKHQLAIKFMNYLDENRPEGKMSLSNGECEDIDKAFKENDWPKIMRYVEKYSPQPKQEWSEEDEKIMNGIQLVLESWDRSHVSSAGLPSLVPKYISWLKDLRPYWKPSKEQIKYLLMLADYFESEGGTSNAKTLREFSEDLRKLI